MLVLCLEGCHGSGKTQLLNSFESKGFEVLDEAFTDMPEYALHPQSLIMETAWMSNWFQRLLQKDYECKQNPDGPKDPVFIADRSPFSAVLYGRRDGDVIKGLIQSLIAEVAEEADIHIVTVHVSTEKELLWSRIQERLVLEPVRGKYNEGSRDWFEKCYNFYHSEMPWDMSVANNHIAIEQVTRNLVRQLTQKMPRYVAPFRSLLTPVQVLPTATPEPLSPSAARHGAHSLAATPTTSPTTGTRLEGEGVGKGLSESGLQVAMERNGLLSTPPRKGAALCGGWDETQAVVC